MLQRTMRRAAGLLLIMIMLFGSLVTVLAGPTNVHAQGGGKEAEELSWADAPVVPRFRSKADWLFDVGWKTYDEVYGPFPTQEYNVGDTELLMPLGYYDGAREVFVLAARTDHAYFWFQRGAHIDPAKLDYTAQFFEEHIWPLNNSIYGDEWNPGIDGDSRIHIVSQITIAPGVYGAFNPEDQCPQFLCPDSNQREIIYINLDTAPLGSPEYLTTVAHEHQHLIQFHVDGNERRWFNEGLSQLAEHLNGFHPRYVGAGNMIDFLENPDHQQDGRSFGYDVGSYYGAGYLFMVYLYEQFGLEFIRAMVANDYDGLASVQLTLDEFGYEMTVDEVAAGWILANYLDDPFVGDGTYYYQTLDIPNPITPSPVTFTGGASQITDTVNQYGADYYALTQPGTYQISFDGNDQTVVTDAAPHSGAWMWWSYNAISSAARLTAAFDLTGLDTATLAFSAWWQVEEDYDWFQVLVSTNGGAEWALVSGEYATRNGPHAPGAHYTARSMRWVDEQIDLNDYVGQEILVRFEYLTDSMDSMQGVALDEIGIVELGGLDDVEQVASVWEPDGFMRVQGMVTQNWYVAVVIHAADGSTTVTPLALDDAYHAGGTTVTVPGGGSATVVIGAMAPFTHELGRYKLAMQHTP
ncbi:MAG: immune inhibitor A [Anaerolineae bacterium]|nr:immune inhibitor A [Anaerolineae bacterium]